MMTDQEHKVWRAQLDAAFAIAKRAIEEMRAAGCSDTMIAEVLDHLSPADGLNELHTIYFPDER